MMFWSSVYINDGVKTLETLIKNNTFKYNYTIHYEPNDKHKVEFIAFLTVSTKN